MEFRASASQITLDQWQIIKKMKLNAWFVAKPEM